MRVIAGAFRGRVLQSPRSREFRPTTDRVKETLFNIIAHRFDLEGASVCDLFAGSGSLGIEALSRGACRAFFVENDRRALATVRENISRLSLEDRATVCPMPVQLFLSSTGEQFDLVFGDPPYERNSLPAVLEIISARNLLRINGLLCLEHEGEKTIDLTAEWKPEAERNFGTTGLTILTLSRKTTFQTT